MMLEDWLVESVFVAAALLALAGIAAESRSAWRSVAYAVLGSAALTVGLAFFAGQAAPAEWIKGPDPRFTFCADPSAARHTACVVITETGAQTCAELPGGAPSYVFQVHPPLCQDFRVVATSFRGTAPDEVTAVSDPSKEYRISPDVAGREGVGIADYGRVAAGFTSGRFGTADFGCLRQYFGQLGPQPLAAPEPVPVCP